MSDVFGQSPDNEEPFATSQLAALEKDLEEKSFQANVATLRVVELATRIDRLVRTAPVAKPGGPLKERLREATEHIEQLRQASAMLDDLRLATAEAVLAHTAGLDAYERVVAAGRLVYGG